MKEKEKGFVVIPAERIAPLKRDRVGEEPVRIGNEYTLNSVSDEEGVLQIRSAADGISDLLGIEFSEKDFPTIRIVDNKDKEYVDYKGAENKILMTKYSFTRLVLNFPMGFSPMLFDGEIAEAALSKLAQSSKHADGEALMKTLEKMSDGLERTITLYNESVGRGMNGNISIDSYFGGSYMKENHLRSMDLDDETYEKLKEYGKTRPDPFIYKWLVDKAAASLYPRISAQYSYEITYHMLDMILQLRLKSETAVEDQAKKEGISKGTAFILYAFEAVPDRLRNRFPGKELMRDSIRQGNVIAMDKEDVDTLMGIAESNMMLPDYRMKANIATLIVALTAYGLLKREPQLNTKEAFRELITDIVSRPDEVYSLMGSVQSDAVKEIVKAVEDQSA